MTKLVTLLGSALLLLSQTIASCTNGTIPVTGTGECMPLSSCEPMEKLNDDPWLVGGSMCAKDRTGLWYSYLKTASDTQQTTYLLQTAEFYSYEWRSRPIRAVVLTADLFGHVRGCEAMVQVTSAHVSDSAKEAPGALFCDFAIVNNGECEKTHADTVLEKMGSCETLSFPNSTRSLPIVVHGGYPIVIMITDGVVVGLALATASFTVSAWVLKGGHRRLAAHAFRWLLLMVVLSIAMCIHFGMLLAACGITACLGLVWLVSCVVWLASCRRRFSASAQAIIGSQSWPFRACGAARRQACGSVQAAPEETTPLAWSTLPVFEKLSTLLRAVLYVLAAVQGVQMSLDPSLWSSATSIGVLRQLANLAPYVGQPLHFLSLSDSDAFFVGRWIVIGLFGAHILVLAASGCLPKRLVHLVDAVMSAPFVLVNAFALQTFSPVSGSDFSIAQIVLMIAIAISVGVRAFLSHRADAGADNPLGLTSAATSLCTFQSLALAYFAILGTVDLNIYIAAAAVISLMRLSSPFVTHSAVVDLLWLYFATAGVLVAWGAAIIAFLPSSQLYVEVVVLALLVVSTCSVLHHLYKLCCKQPTHAHVELKTIAVAAD